MHIKSKVSGEDDQIWAKKERKRKKKEGKKERKKTFILEIHTPCRSSPAASYSRFLCVFQEILAVLILTILRGQMGIFLFRKRINAGKTHFTVPPDSDAFRGFAAFVPQCGSGFVLRSLGLLFKRKGSPISDLPDTSIFASVCLHRADSAIVFLLELLRGLLLWDSNSSGAIILLLLLSDSNSHHSRCFESALNSKLRKPPREPVKVRNPSLLNCNRSRGRSGGCTCVIDNERASCFISTDGFS